MNSTITTCVNNENLRYARVDLRCREQNRRQGSRPLLLKRSLISISRFHSSSILSLSIFGFSNRRYLGCHWLTSETMLAHTPSLISQRRVSRIIGDTE